MTLGLACRVTCHDASVLESVTPHTSLIGGAFETMVANPPEPGDDPAVP